MDNSEEGETIGGRDTSEEEEQFDLGTVGRMVAILRCRALERPNVSASLSAERRALDWWVDSLTTSVRHREYDINCILVIVGKAVVSSDDKVCADEVREVGQRLRNIIASDVNKLREMTSMMSQMPDIVSGISALDTETPDFPDVVIREHYDVQKAWFDAIDNIDGYYRKSFDDARDICSGLDRKLKKIGWSLRREAKAAGSRLRCSNLPPLFLNSATLIRSFLIAWRTDQLRKVESILYRRLEEILDSSGLPEAEDKASRRYSANVLLRNIILVGHEIDAEVKFYCRDKTEMATLLPGILPLAVTLMGMVFCVFDVYSDLLMAYSYWRDDGATWKHGTAYAALTLSLVVLPTLTSGAAGYMSEMLDKYPTRSKVVERTRWVVCYVLQLGPLVGSFYQLTAWLAVHGRMVRDDITPAYIEWKMAQEKVGAVAQVKLAEGALEAAPQLALQLAIRLAEGAHPTTVVQWVTIVSSFMSLALVLLIWSLRHFTSICYRVPVTVTALQFIWHVGMVAPRVLAVACLGSALPRVTVAALAARTAVVAWLYRSAVRGTRIRRLVGLTAFGLLNAVFPNTTEHRQFFTLSFTLRWHALHLTYVIETWLAVLIWAWTADGELRSAWYFGVILAVVFTLPPFGYPCIRICYKYYIVPLMRQEDGGLRMLWHDVTELWRRQRSCGRRSCTVNLQDLCPNVNCCRYCVDSLE